MGCSGYGLHSTLRFAASWIRGFDRGINRIKIPRKNTTANVSSKNDVEKETAEEEETNKIGSEEEAEATIEEKKIPER